jgi:predicted SAM-dependent methyltransferase
MIEIKKGPGQKVLELGCGANRHPSADVAVDSRKTDGVDFAVDMERPFTEAEGQAIGSGEFDCVLCTYALEHVSWRKIPQVLSETLRVLKPGGRAVFITPNTEKQIEWAARNPDGWDGKNFFESVSCILYGDCDYPENSHKAYLTPGILSELFKNAGFGDVVVCPAGARHTDLVVEAAKPEGAVHEALSPATAPAPAPPPAQLPPQEAFDKHYFNGGGKVGGYAREGYWDYPQHQATAAAVLDRKPLSVLELGCARGYVIKRVQDAGVRAVGLEVSRHCYLTRACDGVVLFDLCSDARWPFADGEFDLCLSVAFLEHVPESKLPRLLSEMDRVCRRALHGVDTGKSDDGFDRTHVTLRPPEWWRDAFSKYAPHVAAEIVDKEELDRKMIDARYVEGDGRTKVNLGSCSVMFHSGWENVDVLDMAAYAQAYHYKFRRHDVRGGLPYGTGVVDMIFASHVVEHLTYSEGLSLLKEFRRVLRKDGLARVAVPDAGLLHELYVGAHAHRHALSLADFAEINDGVERAKTDAQRLWAILHEGHASCYDYKTLASLAAEAGLDARPSVFRLPESTHPLAAQMRSETTDMFPDVSLYVNLTPAGA